MSRRGSLLGACLIVVLGTSCQAAPAGSPPTSAAPGGVQPVIRALPDDPSEPYVITAIDYHFHDAHPTLDLAPGRSVTFSNQGSVRHNVTIPALSYSRDIRPGQRITIPRLGARAGGPGIYELYCAYHLDLGMRGTIVVA